MTPELLKRLISDQKEDGTKPSNYIHRTVETLLNTFATNPEIIVITGIRRCGKSVLLQQIRQHHHESDYYFNFEDERLVNFSVHDFQLLQEVLIELYGLQRTYYFDEIQNIPGWELFVRRLYNSGNKIYITGSNASLFSEELGTRLTGRYIAVNMYPFSFYEFLNHQAPDLTSLKTPSTMQVGLIKNAFNLYCHLGGFPEYVKNKQNEYLHSLFEGILYRDIITRYKIPNAKPIKELIYLLASNCSKEMTYNALRKLLGLGSANTVSDYCSYLENSYLCSFVSRYHESVKIQIQSPKKVYFIDHVLAKLIGFHFSEDTGRLLENIVYIELKRRHFEIYYHRATKECDFLIRKNGVIIDAIQVCKSLAIPSTRQREIDGLIEAMEWHNLQDGKILTESEEYSITIKTSLTLTIHVIPLWKWLESSYEFKNSTR